MIEMVPGGPTEIHTEAYGLSSNKLDIRQENVGRWYRGREIKEGMS
jgi:hypothetical protein